MCYMVKRKELCLRAHWKFDTDKIILLVLIYPEEFEVVVITVTKIIMLVLKFWPSWYVKKAFRKLEVVVPAVVPGPLKHVSFSS